MVIIGKLDAKHMDIAAYEQYGQHNDTSLATTHRWASRNGTRYSKKEQAK